MAATAYDTRYRRDLHVRIIDFEKWHLEYLYSQYPEEYNPYFTTPEGVEPWPCYAMTWTILVDDEISGIFGIVKRWEGVGDVFLSRTPLFEQAGFRVARRVRRMLEAVQLSGDYHRIQTVSATEDAIAERWLRFLGMRKECRMEMYGPNQEDFWSWSWVSK